MTAALVAEVFRTFICSACGLIYDEAKGDADGGLAPGTRFDDIPEDWACPLCGVTKADFEPYEVTALPRRAARSTRCAASLRVDAGVVIVGAGRAGWQMAQALRELDADLPITLVAACDAAVYDKPLLSVALAKGLTLSALVKEPAASPPRGPRRAAERAPRHAARSRPWSRRTAGRPSRRGCLRSACRRPGHCRRRPSLRRRSGRRRGR